MVETTVGKILLKHNVPPGLKQYVEETVLDKKGIGNLFNDLAEKSPELYKDTVTNLARLGFEVATRQGSTVSLEDLICPVDKDKMFDDIEHQITEINKGTGTKAEKHQKSIQLYSDLSDRLNKDILTEGLKGNKTLAKVILSGARGSPTQYRQTIAAPVLVTNESGVPMLDFPVKHSFAEGLTAPEYLASSFGSRIGSVQTKISVADSGYFCVSSTELVRMADFSTKCIKDIKVGDWILGANREGNTFPVEVVNVFDNGLRECWHYSFRKGCSPNQIVTIDATEEHKVLAHIRSRHKVKYQPINKYPLSEAKEGFSIIPAKYNISKNGISEKYAYLLGLLIGDGCLVGNRARFACADGKLLEYINSQISPLNLKLTQRKKGIEYTLVEINKSPFHRQTNGDIKKGFCSPLLTWLDELGLLNKTAAYKYIPDIVNQWDLKSVINLVAGLIETDGSVTSNCITYRSVSKELIYGLQKLLAIRLGIYSSISIAKVKGRIVPASPGAPNTKRHNHDAYTLSINNSDCILRFRDLVPIHGVKRDILASYIPRKDYCDFAFHFISKEYLGLKSTYDLEVDHPDHLYVLANGIIVSNSKQLARASMTIRVEEHDCGTDNGIEVAVTDKDSIGCYLAHPTGKYKKNNLITPSVLADLRNSKLEYIIVRSPITCQASRKSHAWAVCQLCCGIRERGTLPQIGEYVGLTASTGLGEVLAQSTLNCLVTGTEVRMADFSIKEIQNIEVDEYVLGSDELGNTFPVRVTNKFDQGKQSVSEYQFTTDIMISVQATKVHLFLCFDKNTEVKSISELGDADIVVADYGNAPLKKIIPMGEKQCWDLEVDSISSLYVLANGMITHNSKHQGASAVLGKTTATGFKLIDQLANIPSTFRGKAAVAAFDGNITKIHKLAQGGLGIVVSNGTKSEEHYAPTGFEAKVAVGDKVEAGDVLSEGLVNPEDVVHHKGIGEGRKYFTDIMNQTFSDAGMNVNRRNFEVISKATIDHVRVNHPEGIGEHLPNSVVSYQAIEKDYKPRSDSQLVRIDLARGKYLEEPVLHFTIGTRLSSSMIEQLKRNGIQSVRVHNDPPGFEPEMQRLLDVPGHVPDFMAQFYSTYIQKRLINAVNTGMKSYLKGPSPVAGLAYARGFGEK